MKGDHGPNHGVILASVHSLDEMHMTANRRPISICFLSREVPSNHHAAHNSHSSGSFVPKSDAVRRILRMIAIVERFHGSTIDER